MKAGFTSDREAVELWRRLAAEVGLAHAPVQLTLLTPSYARAAACVERLLGSGPTQLYCYGLLPKAELPGVLDLMSSNRTVADSVLDIARDARRRKMTYLFRGGRLLVAFNLADAVVEELEVLRRVLKGWRDLGVSGDPEALLQKLSALYSPERQNPTAASAAFSLDSFELTVALKYVATRAPHAESRPRVYTAPKAFVFAARSPLRLTSLHRLADPFITDLAQLDVTCSVSGPQQPLPQGFLDFCRRVYAAIRRPRFTFTVERVRLEAFEHLGGRGEGEILVGTCGVVRFGVPEADFGVQLKLSEAAREVKLYTKDPLPQEAKARLGRSLGVALEAEAG